jgi:hypothetical protein
MRPANLVGVARHVDAVHRHDAGRRQQDAPQHLEVVLFPAPFRPRKPITSPRAMEKFRSAMRSVVAVVLRQASDFDH